MSVAIFSMMEAPLELIFVEYTLSESIYNIHQIINSLSMIFFFTEKTIKIIPAYVSIRAQFAVKHPTKTRFVVARFKRYSHLHTVIFIKMMIF